MNERRKDEQKRKGLMKERRIMKGEMMNTEK